MKKIIILLIIITIIIITAHSCAKEDTKYEAVNLPTYDAVIVEAEKSTDDNYVTISGTEYYVVNVFEDTFNTSADLTSLANKDVDVFGWVDYHTNGVMNKDGHYTILATNYSKDYENSIYNLEVCSFSPRAWQDTGNDKSLIDDAVELSVCWKQSYIRFPKKIDWKDEYCLCVKLSPKHKDGEEISKLNDYVVGISYYCNPSMQRVCVGTDGCGNDTYKEIPTIEKHLIRITFSSLSFYK